MRRALRRALVVMLLAAAAPAAARPIELDAQGMRQLAFKAVQAGYAQDALRYTDALLLRDPRDGTALVIRSQALRALGRTDEAQSAARAAWQAAEGGPGRYGAAMAMAQALSTGGRRTAAQWWLRRAAQNAPNARAEAIARRDFSYVKSRNPWSFQLNASAAPSSNVNNGSTQDRMTLAGLPVEFEIPAGSQALSGFRLGVGIRGAYRFSPNGPGRQTQATFALLGQSVALSSRARALAPDRRGAEFGYAAVEGGLSHRRALDAEGAWALSLGASVGQNWYGQRPLSRYGQLEAGLEHRPDEAARLSFGVTLDRVRRIDSPRQSSDRVEISLGYARQIGAGDMLSLAVTAGRARSQSPEIANEALGARLSWSKGTPVAGIGLSAGLGLERKVFAASRYVAGGRADMRLNANLTMTFTQAEYMGFVPVLDMRASRNRSHAALFDTRDVGVTLGIRSAF